MRFVYLDEAGISPNETAVVVAGVIVDGDRQFRQLEARIQELVEEYVTEEKRLDFAFSAKELANGGKTFVRGVYPANRRLEALRKIAAIPAEFFLPIVVGFDRKSPHPAFKKMSVEQRASVMQWIAYSQCVIAAEVYMRRLSRIDKVAICIVEDNHSARRAIKHMRGLLRRPIPDMSSFSEDLPIGRIIDTVHFAAKNEAVLLQIADACAYVIKRYLAGATYATELFKIMTSNHGPSLEAFDAPGGCGLHLYVPYRESKVATGQAWFASKLVRSSLMPFSAGETYLVPTKPRDGGGR